VSPPSFNQLAIILDIPFGTVHLHSGVYTADGREGDEIATIQSNAPI